MADIQIAINYVIELEDDHSMPGAITKLPGDKGGRTRYGIAETWHKDLTDAGYYDGTPDPHKAGRWIPTAVNNEKALAIARGIYEQEYAKPLHIAEIENQDIANKLLAFGVNAGIREAALLLQRALKVSVDGEIGSDTIGAANRTNSSTLLTALITKEHHFYESLDSSYAKGLDNRADI